jgi:hypothetical protein
MDYRISHQAPDQSSVDDGCAAPLHALGDVMPDVYTRPRDYDHGGPAYGEAIKALQAARGLPGAMVTIYRAAPAGVDVINPGDWITTSLEYARQHAMQDDDASNDWPVLVATVAAADVISDGNDVCEYGYAGPALTGLQAA